MVELDRRELLGTLGLGAVALTAGCGGTGTGDESSTRYRGFYRADAATGLPEPGIAPSLAVVDGYLFEWLGDGDGWTRVPLGRPERSVPQIYTDGLNGEMYATAFDGGDLGERVERALARTNGSGGRVRITAPPDGSPLRWERDLTLNPLDYQGIHLDIDFGVVIEYTGDGWPITIDSEGRHQRDQHRVQIHGGVWNATGDPDGWLRLKDVILSDVRPHQVTFTGGTKDDCTLVSVENHDLYSEANRLSINGQAPIGIDFKPASVTGGDGSGSFHDTYLDQCHLNVSNVGIRFRGLWQYGECRNCAVFARERGVDALVFDAPRMDGTVISAQKVESPPDPGDVTAVVTTADYDGFYGPVLLGGRYDGYGVTTLFRDDSDADADLLQLTQQERSIGVRNLRTGAWTGIGADGSLQVDGRAAFGRAMNYPVEDVRDVPNPSRGYVSYHDGSGDHPEGPAFFDGDRWRSQLDGSTID